MKESTKPKEQFKDRLIEWSQKNLGIKFGDLNPVQQSRQMIKFFVDEILEKLNPGIVPDDEGELEDSIVDGSGDGGADLLYRTDDGLVNPKSIACGSLLKAYEVATLVLTQQYDLKLQNDPGFKHRNWFRDPQTKTDIEKAIALALAFGTQPRLWA